MAPSLPSPARERAFKSPSLDGRGKVEGGNPLKSHALLRNVSACVAAPGRDVHKEISRCELWGYRPNPARVHLCYRSGCDVSSEAASRRLSVDSEISPRLLSFLYRLWRPRRESL